MDELHCTLLVTCLNALPDTPARRGVCGLLTAVRWPMTNAARTGAV